VSFRVAKTTIARTTWKRKIPGASRRLGATSSGFKSPHSVLAGRSFMRHSLDPLFRPRSIAVFGASATPGSVGNILMRNLLENPFGGVVFPINPKRRSVQGVHCYPNLAVVPEKVELAVLATPAAAVPGLVGECVAHGVAAAIIISAGFAELGAEGRK